MKKDMICIACPRGCYMTVEIGDSGEFVSVAGNTCKRGETYAMTEVTNPTRSLTSTVRVVGGMHPVVPVKSAQPVPKGLLFDCMKEINNAEIAAPVKIGDVVIRDILGTGVDIVATNIC